MSETQIWQHGYNNPVAAQPWAQESSLLQLSNLICAHLHRWSQAVVRLLSEAVGDEQAGLKFLI